MTEAEKREILAKAKDFFREKIVDNHKRNTEKLGKLSAFQPNPFLEKYLANFAFGNCDASSIAKALVYPRVLGTSINTTFGTQMQAFCKDVLSGFASTTPGIDIEFVDQLDGRCKYCQIKAGPNTINNDDVTTIKNHFESIRRIARTNGLREFNADVDCIVGIFYGSDKDLSASYKTIDASHPVYAGKDFWHHLTGDPNFYNGLINEIASIATEVDGTELLNNVINQLSAEIEEKYNQ